MNPVIVSTAVAQAGLGYYNFIHEPSISSKNREPNDINRIAFIDESNNSFKSVEGVSIDEEGILNCKTLRVNNKKFPASLKRRYSVLRSDEEEVAENEKVLVQNGELVCKGIDIDNVKLGKDLFASTDGFLAVENGKVVTKTVPSTDPKRVFVNEIASQVPISSMALFGNVGARDLRNSEIRVNNLVVGRNEPELIEFNRDISGEIVIGNGFPLFQIDKFTEPAPGTWFLTGRAKDSVSVKLLFPAEEGVLNVNWNENVLTLAAVPNDYVEIPRTTDTNPTVSSNASNQFSSLKWDLTAANSEENVYLVYKTDGSIGFSSAPLSGSSILKNHHLLKPNSAISVGFVDNKISEIEPAWILDPTVEDERLIMIGYDKTITCKPYYVTDDKKIYPFAEHVLTITDDKILIPFHFPTLPSDGLVRTIVRKDGSFNASTILLVDPIADYTPAKDSSVTPTITGGKFDFDNSIGYGAYTCIIEEIRLKDCFLGDFLGKHTSQTLGIYEKNGTFEIMEIFNPLLNEVDLGEITSKSRLLILEPDKSLFLEPPEETITPIFGGPDKSCILFREKKPFEAHFRNGEDHFLETFARGTAAEGYEDDDENAGREVFVATYWSIESHNDMDLIIDIFPEEDEHDEKLMHSGYLFPLTKLEKHYCSTFHYMDIFDHAFPAIRLRSLTDIRNPFSITLSYFAEIRIR